MTLPEFLSQDKYGFIQVAGHRVGLVDIVDFYRQGDSPEMLHARFPTISLAMCHKVIAYYLENQLDVDTYCTRHHEEMTRQRAQSRPGPSIDEMQRRREVETMTIMSA